jgi:hypothetical protein
MILNTGNDRALFPKNTKVLGNPYLIISTDNKRERFPGKNKALNNS